MNYFFSRISRIDEKELFRVLSFYVRRISAIATASKLKVTFHQRELTWKPLRQEVFSFITHVHLFCLEFF